MRDLGQQDAIRFHINTMPADTEKVFLIIYKSRYHSKKEVIFLYQFKHREVTENKEDLMIDPSLLWQPCSFLSTNKPSIWTPKMKVLKEQKSQIFVEKKF